MMSETGPVDGSWELSITVTDLQVDKYLRVKGDTHIGGVMLQLVESLDIPMDWSDHALWWPERKIWLSRTRSTLDQYSVQSDARLWFTPMHKILKVQMPDLQTLDMRVDFSINVFNVVIQLCKELGIRHPEELSLSRKLDKVELKKNKGLSPPTHKPRPPHSPYTNGTYGQSNSFDGTLGHSPIRSPHTPQGTIGRTPGSPYGYGTLSSQHMYNGTLTPGSMHSLSFEGAMETGLANSPMTPTREALLELYKPKNYAEKARINAGWFDSSRSLFEQEIKENDVVLLRFKFYNFYDLNPKYDLIRINQIFEQAKWALISEEVDCTEEEMMMFAALQLQIQLQSQVPQPDFDGSNPGEDDIDAALNDLQVSLEGSSLATPGDITHIPELQDYLKFFKPKKFSLKSFKRYYFTFKDTHICMFKSKQDVNDPPILKVNLKGCEVNPDVNISSNRFNIKLFVPSEEGMTENWIKAETEDQYASWMAACRLASKGKTMADSSYDSEVQSIRAFLSMQHPSPHSGNTIETSRIDFQPEDFVAPRFLKKLKTKQIANRILEAHANVQEMNLLESKLYFIKAWQSLPEFGITYFIVKFKTGRKEELLGIASNRLIRLDMHNGDSLKTWRYSNMKTWSVNWEVQQVLVEFSDGDVAFHCLTADCKVVHEFIGGYIFLSMRSGDKNQSLNQELFHKLTGGWTR